MLPWAHLPGSRNEGRVSPLWPVGFAALRMVQDCWGPPTFPARFERGASCQQDNRRWVPRNSQWTPGRAAPERRTPALGTGRFAVSPGNHIHRSLPQLSRMEEQVLQSRYRNYRLNRLCPDPQSRITQRPFLGVGGRRRIYANSRIPMHKGHIPRRHPLLKQRSGPPTR